MTEYEIFKSCFPELRLDERQFRELSGISSGQTFCCDGGFALVSGNCVRLLCVAPEKRKTGVGTSLLKKAEEHIRSLGYSRAELGGTDSGLLIGAPEDCSRFFTQRGYTLNERVAEMYGTPDMLRSAPAAEGADFEFCRGSGLPEAVAAVDRDWVQYFDGGEIFCGYSGGKIASFCLLDDDVDCLFSDGTRVGSIGCVGTVPEFRRRGIGLKMVELAARELYHRGCEKIFIHYTGVYEWYAKIGFRTGIMLRLGGKIF
ncbi:MAG: GNAT family N-acetyltransferase [Oscillospiraceae bacterium]|nr:GNAT family N-acetyltransferase [Oscillospiraceae bacterium]